MTHGLAGQSGQLRMHLLEVKNLHVEVEGKKNP